VKESKLTQARLCELLHYDPHTGKFRWRVRKKRGNEVGTIAGCRIRWNYWCIHLDGRSYRAHQLAWLYMKGEWGRPLIDHRDGNPLNNRWANLRVSTGSNNAANRKRYRSNTSGYKGVSFHRRARKWTAYITKETRRYNLGYFATAEQAHKAYVAAARLLFGEFARPE
jgi:HNH endonuclease/AP2 domain